MSKRFCACHRPQDLTNPPCTERVFHCGRRSAAAYRWSSPQTEGQPAGNVWKRWPPCSANGETHVRHVHQMRRRVSSCLIEREGQSAGGSRGFCLSLVCRRGGNDCEQHSSLQHQHKSSLITALKHRGYQHQHHQHHQPEKSFTSLSVRIVGNMSVSTADAEGKEKHVVLASENTFKIKEISRC